MTLYLGAILPSFVLGNYSEKRVYLRIFRVYGVLAKDYAGMFQAKPSACTINGLKNAKESAYDQAEEECDYKIIDSMIDNTIGLACDHIFNQKRNFMFKNEYCSKYIK